MHVKALNNVGVYRDPIMNTKKQIKFTFFHFPTTLQNKTENDQG